MSAMGGKFNKAGRAIRKSGFNYWLWYSFSLCNKSFHLLKLLFPQCKWDSICLLFQMLWELIYSYLGKHFKFIIWEPVLDLGIKLTVDWEYFSSTARSLAQICLPQFETPFTQLQPQLLKQNVYSWHTGISSLNYTSLICEEHKRTVTKLYLLHWIKFMARLWSLAWLSQVFLTSGEFLIPPPILTSFLQSQSSFFTCLLKT